MTGWSSIEIVEIFQTIRCWTVESIVEWMAIELTDGVVSGLGSQ